LTLKYTVSIEELRNTIHYDPFTGKLYKKIFERDGRSLSLEEAFLSESEGYLSGGHFGHNYSAHRMAWAIYYGKWPELEIDHINGDRSDNRIKNLRDVLHIVNVNNRHPGKYSPKKRNCRPRYKPEDRKPVLGVGLKPAEILPGEVYKDTFCPPAPSSSGVRGVYFNKATEKWMARIKINKKWVYLGIHKDLADAAAARAAAEAHYATPREPRLTLSHFV